MKTIGSELTLLPLVILSILLGKNNQLVWLQKAAMGKNNALGKENTLGLYGMQNHSMTCRKKYSRFIHSTFLSITAYKGLESLQNYISTSSCINFCLQKNLALLKRGSWCRSNEITTFVDVFLNSASFINSFSDANSNRRVEKGASF